MMIIVVIVVIVVIVIIAPGRRRPHRLLPEPERSPDRAEQRAPSIGRTHRILLRCHTVSASWLGNIDPIPFRETRQSLCVRNMPVS